jgi:hypothetical protein
MVYGEKNIIHNSELGFTNVKENIQ